MNIVRVDVLQFSSFTSAISTEKTDVSHAVM